SFLHVPIDLDQEQKLDAEMKSWLAFAVQKIEELAILGRALDGGRASVAKELKAYSDAAKARKTSPKIHNAAVQDRLKNVTAKDSRRVPFNERRKAQVEKYALPAFPTTSIGSFPQTEEVRKARAANTKGTLSDADYNTFLKKATEEAI